MENNGILGAYLRPHDVLPPRMDETPFIGAVFEDGAYLVLPFVCVRAGQAPDRVVRLVDSTELTITHWAELPIMDDAENQGGQLLAFALLAESIAHVFDYAGLGAYRITSTDRGVFVTFRDTATAPDQSARLATYVSKKE